MTHAGIDGYSRMVVYLKCSTNNQARTVYGLFLPAIRQYGLPSRLRCDQGGQNHLVAQHMIHHRGADRRSVIVGSSVHNQRIERFWRDTCLHYIMCINPRSTLPLISSAKDGITMALERNTVCHQISSLLLEYFVCSAPI